MILCILCQIKISFLQKYRLQITLSCVRSSAISCAPVFVQVVSPPIGWHPLSYFLVVWSPSGHTRGPSVVFEAVDMPCPGPCHCSHRFDHIHDPDVGLSIFVCDVEHTSFDFGLFGRKFVLCLFGQPICWQTQILHPLKIRQFY